MLKIVPEVTGRTAVPGLELFRVRAVSGRLVAVAGRDGKETAVLGRDARRDSCDWEPIDRAVMGRVGSAPAACPFPPEGTGGMEADTGGPAGARPRGATISDVDVVFSTLWGGSPPVELTREAGRSAAVDPATEGFRPAVDPATEGLRERRGVLLREPPTRRTSGVTCLGLRSSPIMTRVSRWSTSFCATSRRAWCENLRAHAQHQAAWTPGPQAPRGAARRAAGGGRHCAGQPTRCNGGAPTTSSRARRGCTPNL